MPAGWARSPRPWPSLSNNGNEDIVLGSTQIKPGAKQTITTGFPYLEVGIGLQRLLFDDEQRGGFIVGVGSGTQISARGRWTDESDREAAGVNDARLFCAFFRLTVGGGGFFYR